MGKKRRQNGRRKAEDNNGDDYSNMPEPDQESEEYFNDEIEAFATKDDKILLDIDGANSSEESDDIVDDEDEILKLDTDDSDMEEDDDIEGYHESKHKQDSEDNEDFFSEEESADGEEGLPSQKAWGRRKKEFYDSNLKDADHFENEEEEEIAVEEEEKEAMALQQRMVSHLDQEDFDFFDAEQKETNEVDEVIEMEEETHVVQDLQKLSKEEKVQLLMKESPELFVLLDDYETKLNDVIHKYHPLLLIARKGGKISKEGQEFIEVMHQLLLNYCLNISFYLALKAKRESVKDHPVIEKILEYKNLLSKVEPFEKAVEDEILLILKKTTEPDDASLAADDMLSSHDIKTLAKQAKSMRTVVSKPKAKADRPAKQDPQRKRLKNEAKQDPWDYYMSVAKKKEDKQKLVVDGSHISTAMHNVENNEEEEDGKRAITYEMAKNKGLIRKRKKENRNPRVKHKMKFKKAVVRRKSQVPAIRNEAVSYGGELTGIKSRVVKSVKIK